MPNVHVVVTGSELLYGVAWLDNGTILVGRNTANGSRLFDLDAQTGTQIAARQPPAVPGCDKIDEGGPRSTNEGLWWLRVCVHGADPRKYSVIHVGNDGAVSVEHQFETVFTATSLATDGGIAFVEYGSRICNTIIRIGANGLSPEHVTVESPSGSFDVGWDVRADCDRMGVARLPALRGGTLAFMASGPSSAQGPDRLLVPSNLYVASLGDAAARRVPLGIVDPGALLWVDEGHLIVSGERSAEGRGTWLVDVATGTTERVLAFVARSIGVSPDRQTVVAMRSVAGKVLADEVVVFPASLLAP
jgi:hypothetical protein